VLFLEKRWVSKIMGFNPSPESDDPARKTTAAVEFSGFQLPVTLSDRPDDSWRKPQSFQQEPGFPTLPSLEIHNKAEDLRSRLPVELQLLYGDPSLLQKPAAKPDVKPEIPGFQPPSERTPAASPVKTDAAGYAVDINYPDGKVRHIERDPQTHEAKAIITRNSEGTTRLVNQSGRWFLEVQGMQLPFAGKVEAARNGEISMQTSADGVWRVEKPDGSVSEEKENADGARVSFDAAHHLSKITRADGTTYQQVDAATIVETHPGGKPITWTNLQGLWSADNGDKPRKNLALNDNATVTFDDANGIKHTINGRGLETLEGAGLGKIIPDAKNRPAEVETADGKRVRKYEYFDENGNDLKTVTVVDKVNNTTTVYTRQSKDSTSWRSDKGGVWNGEVRVSPDGVHSIRSRGYNDSDSKWTSYYADGRETTDTINADGSRASYDKQNNLVSFLGADGVKIDRFTAGGQETIRYYDPKAGETINWTKGSDGNWTADSARFKDARKDLSFNTSGELSYANDRGGRVQEHRDGTKQITEKDGTRLDFDRDGQIIKAVKGNLERTFIRDAGGIAVVKDRNLTSKQEKTIFERRPAGEENRSNIFVSANGDLSYQNPDGTAVIERSNMLRLELDRDGDISRVVGPKSTRTFQYIGDADHKAVVNIVDTRYGEKGQARVETWTRVANPDGTLSSEFRSVDDKGKERKSRYNLTPCADGEYEYRLATDKPNDKPHVEKLNGSSDGEMPADIEEARESLTSILEGVMDKSRLEANIGYMKKFEQRMMDQSELQIAAGLDPDKVMRETQRSIVDTYIHCARLAGTAKAPNEMYGLNDRVRLAENLLYLANDPTDIKQGGQGTCWWESSWNVGLFQRNAGDAARFCADIALTRQYTSTAGPLRGGPPKTLKVPAQYVGLGGHDSGRGWTPGNSRSSSQRSIVGMLIDQCGPPLGGQRGWGQSNAGWHTEARNILYMMTGRDNIRHGGFSLGQHEKIELLKTGGWTASGSNHMWAYSMHKDKNGEWVVIKDDQYQGGDHVIQRIPNLKAWISANAKSEVIKGWRAHPRRANDDSNYTPMPAPVPRPTPSPNPHYNPRPQDDDSDNYDNNDNNDNNDYDDDDDDDGCGRLNLLQMARPIWRIARHW
jgi:hypothetical protein